MAKFQYKIVLGAAVVYCRDAEGLAYTLKEVNSPFLQPGEFQQRHQLMQSEGRPLSVPIVEQLQKIIHRLRNPKLTDPFLDMLGQLRMSVKGMNVVELSDHFSYATGRVKNMINLLERIMVENGLTLADAIQCDTTTFAMANNVIWRLAPAMREAMDSMPVESGKTKDNEDPDNNSTWEAQVKDVLSDLHGERAIVAVFEELYPYPNGLTLEALDTVLYQSAWDANAVFDRIEEVADVHNVAYDSIIVMSTQEQEDDDDVDVYSLGIRARAIVGEWLESMDNAVTPIKSKVKKAKKVIGPVLQGSKKTKKSKSTESTEFEGPMTALWDHLQGESVRVLIDRLYMTQYDGGEYTTCTQLEKMKYFKANPRVLGQAFGQIRRCLGKHKDYGLKFDDLISITIHEEKKGEVKHIALTPQFYQWLYESDRSGDYTPVEKLTSVSKKS